MSSFFGTLTTASNKSKCFYICPTVTLISLYFIWIYAHRLTCFVHLGLCTPIHSFTNSLENPYSKLSEHEYHQTLQELWNSDYHTSTTACTTPLQSTTSNEVTIQLGILLTDSPVETATITKKFTAFENIAINPLSLSSNDLNAKSPRNSQTKKVLVMALDNAFNQCIENHSKKKQKSKVSEFNCFVSMDMLSIPVSLYDVFTDYLV